MVNKSIKIKMTKVGVFGGTFDPIHLGHTKSALKTLQELNLSKILFIPAHIPPHKNCFNSAPTASPEQRSLMVELITEEHPLFECDKRELKRKKHSYTVDTLIELKQEFSDKSLCFIIGMDSLLSFTRWHRYQDILKLCNLVVNTRPNYDLSQVNDETKLLLANHQVHNIDELDRTCNGAIYFTKPLSLNVSSTQIRHNLQNDISCHSQLSTSVIDFINKNQLYR
jgi:nicotinate-nucleotide adenylyltransferase